MSDSVSDITSDITDVSEIPPSTTTISTVAVQAGKSRVVLAILRSGEWIQVRVHQMEPDIMDIGTNLEEARQLHQEHIGLLSQLKAKEDEIKELLAKADTNVADRGESQRDVCAAMAETLGEAWKDLNAKLEYRGKLLEQSVAFHTTANEFGNQLEKALNTCINVPLANDVEHAQNLLQQHQELKKGILESSKQTLDLGHELLDKIRKMGMHADQQNRHATTAACYGIEHLLELLHDRRRHLEELWAQRKLQLEQCLQLCLLDQEVYKILEWYRTVGEAYLQRTELGVSVEIAQNELDNYHKYEKEGITIQDNVLKLVRTADQLLRRANLDAEGVRQRLQAVDETSENFMIKLDNRRKNIAMALSFFKQAEAALTKLGQIEVQLNTMDLPRNSTALAEESAKLSNAIVESTTEALHEGRILLERVGRDDSGANGVRQKYAELQECCARVESICKARQADAWEKNQAYLNFQEKYKNLQAWLTQIGLATLSRHKDLGSSLANSKDFLEIHQQLLEEVRGKETEMQSLSEAAASLVMSGNQEGTAAKDMSEALHHQWFHIQKIITIRIELSLIFVSFHKITHNLASSTGSFENILRSETDDLQDITEDAVKNLQGMWSQTLKIHKELQELGNTFLQKTSTVTDDSDLDVAKSVTLVEKMLNEYSYHMVSLTERWEIWQQRVSSSQQFKVQWHQFIQDARKTIDWVMKVEHDFFPVIAGQLGTSMENVQGYQNRLDDFLPVYKTIDWIMSVEQELFMPYISGHLGENKQTTGELQKKLEDYGPIVKEAEEKIKVHLKTAEELASKGNTKGQKDQITNELVKVHQRFQARITEYQILLKLTIQFFGSLHQLDELINRTEKEYTTAELPSDLNQAERMLEEHKMKKSEVNQLLTFTADEGEKIVVRVRQQGADAAAQDEVRRVMEISENYKRRWNQTWEEHDRRLAQNLQICQFNFDLRQIHSEIDELHHHLQARRGNYGNNLPAARMTSQAFQQFEMTVELIEKKINSFISTAELMVQDKHYDSVHIHEEIDVLKKKWSTFHTSVTDYRTLLDISVMYFQMIEETEQWIRDGNQMLINIGRQATECEQASEAITLILKLQKFVDSEKAIMEEKINKISELSVQLYGDQGASKVRHVVVAHQDLMQSFQQADNELSALKQKLEGGEPMAVDEHIPMQVDIPVNEQVPTMKPPRITQHLKNAEVLEGSKFTFECHIESEVIPEVKWFKDSLPLTSPDYETCFANGIATLTIEETFSEDTARYTCRVANEVGAVESSAQLIVKETHQQIIPPDFTRNLKSADVLEGSPFTFECHMTGMPSPDISWYKDDHNIDNSPDFVITQINGTCCLKLRKATLNESARYTCRAINAGGEAASSARLTIKPIEKPVIHEPLADQTSTEGKGVRLRVVYTGVPAPDVSWFKGTEEIVTSNVFKISTEHNFSVLDVMEAYPEDSGTYSALIRNVAGEAKTSCQVNIETAYSSAGEDTSQTSTDVEPLKPYFSQLLKTNYEAPEGTAVRLDCIIVGHPEPEVIWYHNEKPVKESKDIQLQFFGDRCTLVIREVLLEDSGIYKCVACNLHGVAESQCLLHVEALSEMSDTSAGELSPPVFPELLNDIACNAGDKIILKCQVQGNPPPVVQWFREGILIEHSADYQITCENDVHLLTIPEAFAEDNGTFMVNAVNPAGEAKCYAKIIIKNENNKPGADKVTMVRRTVEKVTKVTRTEEIKQAPPEFTKLFQDLTVKMGEPVTLECIITGTPKPRVSWQFDGENIYSTPYQATMEGDKYRLVINQVSESDAGRFSITAENPSGRATCSARLVVEKAAPTPAPAPVPVPVIPMETQFTHTTVTQSETRLSRIIADMQEKNYAEMERHSTTITTQVPPKFEVKGPAVATQDRFATSITTDVAPQYQQVDLTIEVPIPPKFLQALKNITALEGTKVTFDGVVTGKPEPSIKWYKKDKEITDAADFEISYKDGRVSLTIPEVIEEHSGQVTCTASNYVGTASSTAELIVKASMIPPSFTERLQKRQVKEGEAVKLTVRVAGTPAPQVMWYREGSHIVSSPDFEIIQEGDIHTLYIPEVFYEDSGKFTVKAKNPAGEASCCAELRVKAPAMESVAQIEISKKADIYMQPVEPPAPVTESVIPQMQKPSAYSPSPIRHVQAPVPKPVQSPIPKPVPSPAPSPKPVDQPLIKPMKAPVPKAPASQSVQPPIIKPVQAPVKTEVAMEIEGEEPVLPPFEKRIKLFDQPVEETPILKNVNTKPQAKPVAREKPSFSTTLRDIHVDEGEKVVLEVVITGRPEPTVKWFREDNLLNSTPDFEITYANGISRLVIAEVFPEDSGKYACVASNIEGSCTATAYLNVKAAPSSSGSASPMSASRSSTRIISPVVAAAAAAEPVSMSPVAPSPILGFRKVPFKVPSPGPHPAAPQAPPPPPPPPESPIIPSQRPPVTKPAKPANQPPKFIEKLQNATIIEGTNVMMECKVTGVPFPHIMWTRMGLPVMEDERHKIHVDSVSGRCSFFVAKCAFEDKGSYTCSAQNIAGQDTTTASLLAAQAQPEKVEKQVQPLHQPETRLDTKKPPPHEFYIPRPERVLAERAEDRLSQTQDFKSSAFEDRLKKEIQFRDGKIHCIGDTGSTSEYDSEHPEDKVSFVKEFPKISQTLKDFKLIEGSDATFVCKVSGKPRPKIAWYKDGKRVKRSKHSEMKYTHDGYCTLKIKNALREDAGCYTVFAVNSSGRDTCSAELFLDVKGIDRSSFVEPETLERMLRRDKEKPQESGKGGVFEVSSKPVFQKIPESQEVREGQTVRFDCYVTGRPYPEITWYKNDVELYTDDLHKVVVNENGIHSVIILSASSQDAGQYKCVARNKGGMATFTISLNVSERQQVHPPQFIERLQSFTIKETNSATLSCAAVGFPLPMMSWQKDGKMLSNKEYKITIDGGRSSLTIDNATLDDSAWFQCSAVNVSGSASTRAKLTVLGTGPSYVEPPEKPMFGFIRKDSPPKYDIQPEGPVQQISYATEHDSATLKLMREDDIASSYQIHEDGLVQQIGYASETESGVVKINKKKSKKKPSVPTVPSQKPTRARGKVPAVLPKSEEIIQPSDETDFKQPSIAQAKMLFDATGKPLPPPATLPKESVAPSTMPIYATAKHVAAPTPTIAPSQAPVPAASTAGRGDSPPSYELQEEGPVQQISYASEIGSAVLKIVEQVDIKRDDGKQVMEPLPVSEKTEPSKVAPVAAPKPALKPVKKQVATAPPPAPVTKPVAPAPILKPVSAPVAKAPRRPKPIERKLSPEEVRDHPVAIQQGKTVWSSETSEVYKALMEQSLESTNIESSTVDISTVSIQKETERQLEKIAKESHGRRSSVHPTEDMFQKTIRKMPQFKSKLKGTRVMEYERTHLECILTPINDPTMKVEWFKDGVPLLHGHRYRPCYEFGYVVLDLLFTIPEDSGVYSIVATNINGEATTSAEVICDSKTSIIIGTQLPEGQQTIERLRQLDQYRRFSLMVGNFAEDDVPVEPSPPSIEIKPEPVEIDEGETAKFIVNVSGYPRPRVTWWINGSLVVAGSRFRVRYDGMIHYLEIPRVREYDTGQIRIFAKNQQGEAEAITVLKVIPKEDWRSRLRHAPQEDLQVELERRKRVELRSAELKTAQVKSTLSAFELSMLTHESTFRKNTTDVHLQKFLVEEEERKKKKTFTTTKQVEFTEREISEPSLLPATKEEPPVFITPLCPTKVPEGKPVSLEVKFSGHPPPILTWYRDDFEIHSSWDFQIRITETSSTLHISEAFPEDTGMYTVKAYNKYGMTQCKAKLTVLEEVDTVREVSPEFRNLLRDTKVVVGEPATFDCEVTGKPKPEVYWQKNGKNMPESPRWKFIHEDNHYTLLIFEVQPEDAGTYACVSINSSGKSTCTAKLLVDETLVKKESHASLKLAKKIQIKTPSVLEVPENRTVPESESVTFRCKIIGTPAPIVSWYYNNHLVKPSKYFKMTSTQDGVHTLTLLEAFPEDSGQYRCVARNKAGETSCVCNLVVVGMESEPEPAAPETVVQPPSFIKPISNIVIDEGSPTCFEAVFAGVPEPEITWLRNGEPIQNTRDFKIDRVGNMTLLAIKEAFPEDSGLITCRARNCAGVAECSAEFYVQEEEEKPDDKISQTGIRLVQPKLPVFRRSLPQTYKVKVGQTARLEAQIDAYPPPLTKWYVNGVEIVTSEHYQMIQEGNTVVLIIFRIRKQDAGEYILRVGNELGEATCRTTIIIEGKKKEISVPDVTDTVTVKMIEKQEKTVTTQIRKVKPVFVEPIQRDICIRERGIARLECTIEAHPPPVITWYINGMEIKPSPHYEMFYESGKSLLLIIDVGPEDTGEYTCHAVSEIGQAMCSTTLYVQEPAMAEMSPPPEDHAQVEPSPAEKVYPPYFVDNLQSTQVFDGHAIKLICRVEGKPIPNISWFHNGTNIDNNDEYVISYNPDTGCVCLHIVEALPEDQGAYVCKATNLAGQATTSATLTVIVPTKETVTAVRREGEKAKPAAIPPTFVETLQPQTVQDGSQVVLTCRINAYPQPKVTWYKDEIQIVPSNDFHITFEIESGRCSLIISEVYPEDAGDYSCHAINIYGESVTTTTITVETVETTTETYTDEMIRLVDERYLTRVEMSPQYTQPRDVQQGRPIRLICKLTGKPNVSWYINEVEIQPSSNRRMYTEHNTSILLIVCASYEDTGEYICRMENKEGVSISKASVNVMKQIEAPLQETASPDFTQLLQPQTVRDGERVEFKVRFTGVPRPRITWFHNGNVIQSTNDIRVTIDYERGESMLIIVEIFPEDEGEYTCSASNEYGEIITTCKLTVISSSDSEAIESDETHKETIVVDHPQIVELPDEPTYSENVLVLHEPRRQSEVEMFYDAPDEFAQTEEIRTISTTTKYFEQTEPQPDIKSKETHSTVLTVDKEEEPRPVELRFQVPRPSIETVTEIHESTCITTEEIPMKKEEELVIESEDIHKETIEIINRKQPEVEVVEAKQPISHPPVQRIEVEVKEHVMKKKQQDIQVIQLTESIDKPSSEGAVEVPSQITETISITRDTIQVKKETPLEKVGLDIPILPKEAEPEKVEMKITIKEEPEKITPEEVVESVGKAPEFTWSLMSLKVMDGEEVKFHCDVTGQPMPEISWYHDDKEMLENQDFKITYNKETGACTLLIVEVFPQDAGEYRCEATNPFGSAVSRADLEIESYEYVPDSEEASSQEAPSPKPALDEVDMKPLTYEEVRQLVKEEKSQAQVFAETVEVNVARKREQELSKSEITQMSKQIESALVIQQQSEATTQMRRVAAETQRPDEGFPKLSKVLPVQEVTETATTSLLKEHVQEMTTSQGITMIQGEVSQIATNLSQTFPIEEHITTHEISKVSKAEEFQTEAREVSPIEGQYTHHEASISKTAISEELTQEERIADIKLLTTESGALTSVPFESVKAECQDAPQILETLEMPKFETGLRNISVIENNVLHLEVFVSGTTVPIKWYMDNVELGPSPGVIIREEGGHSEYIIEECYPEDEGLYTAVATNKFGTVKSSAYITIQSPSGPSITEIQKGDSFESEDTFEECIEPVISSDTDDFEECIQDDAESKVTIEEHVDKDIIIHKVGYSLKGVDSTQFKSEIIMSPELEKQEIHFAVSPETVVQEEICMSENTREIPYTDTITLEVDKQKEEIVKTELSTDVLADSSFKNVLMLEPTNIMVALDEVDAATNEKMQIYLAEEGKEMIDEESFSDFKIGSDIIEAQISENLAVEKSEIMRQKEVCSEQIPESLNEEYSIDISRVPSPLEVALEIITPTDEHHKFVEQETQKVDQIPEELAEENIDLFPREPSPIEPTPEVVESKGVEQYGVMEKGIQKVEMLPEDLEAEHTDLFPREPSPIESTPEVVESKGVEQYGVMEKGIQKVDQIPEELEAETTDVFKKEPSPIEPAPEVVKSEGVEQHSVTDKGIQKVDQVPEELEAESTDMFRREPSPIEPTPEVVKSEDTEQHDVTEKGIQKVDQIPEELEAENTDLFPREPSPIEPTPEVVKSEDTEQHGVTEKGIQKVDQIPEELEAENTDLFPREHSPIEPTPEVVKSEDTEQHGVTEKGIQKVDQIPEELEAENTDLFPREPSPIEPTPEVVKSEDTEQHGVTEKGIQKVDQIPEELEAENTDLFPREPSPIEPTPEVVKSEDTEQHGVTEKGIQKVDQIPEELEAENTDLFPREPSPIEPTPEVVKSEDTEQHGVTEKGIQKVDQIPEELEAENTDLFPREPSPIEPTPEVVKSEDTEQHGVTEKGIQKVDQIPEELEAENTDLFPREPSPIEPTPEVVKSEDTEQHGVTEKGIQKVDQIPEELEAENTDLFPREPSPIEPTPEVVKSEDTEQHGVTEKGIQKVDQIPEELEAENTDLFPREPSPIEPAPEVVKHEDTEQHGVTEKGIQKVDQIPEELEAENTDLFPREPSPIEPTPEVVKFEDTEQHGVTEKGIQKVDQIPEELEAENTDLFPREPSPIEPTPEVVKSEDTEQHGVTEKGIQKVDQVPEELEAENTDLFPREPSPIEPTPEVVKSEDTEQHGVTEKGIQKVDQIPEELEAENTDLFPREPSPIEPTPEVVKHEDTEQHGVTEKGIQKVDQIPEELEAENTDLFPREPSPIEPTPEVVKSEDTEQHGVTEKGVQKVDQVPEELEAENTDLFPREPSPIEPSREVVQSQDVERHDVTDKDVQKVDQIPEDLKAESTDLVQREPSPTEPFRDIIMSEDTERHGVTEKGVQKVDQVPEILKEEDTELFPRETSPIEPATDVVQSLCTEHIDSSEQQEINVDHVSEDMILEILAVVPREESPAKPSEEFDQSEGVKEQISVDITEIKVDAIAGDVESETLQKVIEELYPVTPMTQIVKSPSTEILAISQGSICTEELPETTEMDRLLIVPKEPSPGLAELVIDDSSEIVIAAVQETMIKVAPDEVEEFEDAFEASDESSEDFEECEVYVDVQKVERGISVSELQKHDITLAEHAPIVMEIEEQFKSELNIQPERRVKSNIDINVNEVTHHDIAIVEPTRKTEQIQIVSAESTQKVSEKVQLDISLEKKETKVTEVAAKRTYRQTAEVAPKTKLEQVHFEIEPSKEIEITKKEKVVKEIITKEEEKHVEETAVFREGVEIAPKPVFEEVHFEIKPQQEIAITRKEKVVEEVVSKEEETYAEQTPVFKEGVKITPKKVFKEVHFEIEPEKEIEITKKEKVVREIITKEEEKPVEETAVFREAVEIAPKPVFEEVHFQIAPEKQIEITKKEKVVQEIVTKEEEKPVEETAVFREGLEIAPKPVFEEVHFQIAPEKQIEITKKEKVVKEIVMKEEEKPVEETAVFREGLEIAPKPVFEEVHFQIAPEKQIEITKKEKVVKEIVMKEEEKPVEETAVFREGLEIAPKPVFEEVHFQIAPEKQIEITKKEKVVKEIVMKEEEKPVEETAVFREGLEIAPKPVFEEVHFQIAPEKEIEIIQKEKVVKTIVTKEETDVPATGLFKEGISFDTKPTFEEVQLDLNLDATLTENITREVVSIEEITDIDFSVSSSQAYTVTESDVTEVKEDEMSLTEVVKSPDVFEIKQRETISIETIDTLSSTEPEPATFEKEIKFTRKPPVEGVQLDISVSEPSITVVKKEVVTESQSFVVSEEVLPESEQVVEVSTKYKETIRLNIVKDFNDICTWAGDRFILEIIFDAYPAPRISWFFEDEPIESTEEFKIVIEEKRTMIIVKQAILEDEGEYRVKIENEAGSLISTAYVTVLPPAGTDFEFQVQKSVVSEQQKKEIKEEFHKLEVSVDVKREHKKSESPPVAEVSPLIAKTETTIITEETAQTITSRRVDKEITQTAPSEGGEPAHFEDSSMQTFLLAMIMAMMLMRFMAWLLSFGCCFWCCFFCCLWQ